MSYEKERVLKALLNYWGSLQDLIYWRKFLMDIAPGDLGEAVKDAHMFGRCDVILRTRRNMESVSELIKDFPDIKSAS